MRLDWYETTTAQAACLYPFHVDRSFGVRAPIMGRHMTGGRGLFCFDPFALYPDVVEGPNVIVMGAKGTGKSTTFKDFVWREWAVYGKRRFFSIGDPKDEYDALAAAMGMPVVRLYPGGQHRVNAMDPPPGGDPADVLSRQQLAVGLVGGLMRRRVDELEEAALTWTIHRLGLTGKPFTLVDVYRELQETDPRAAGAVNAPAALWEPAVMRVQIALDKLLTRTLRGMFDGPSNVRIDWDNGPGFVLNVSSVFGNSEAFPLVMLTATSWQAAQLMRSWDRRVILGWDEVWAAVELAAEQFQTWLKLSRTLGVSIWMLCHRPGDLLAQSDEGTKSAKIAAGLLSDIDTRILFRQPPEQVAPAAELFDLSARQQVDLTRLPRGRSIWLMTRRSAIVHHIQTAGEARITFTDENMVA